MTQSLSVSREAALGADPATIWDAIGDFACLDQWHPIVASCQTETVDGALRRRLRTIDGAELVEELVENDHNARRYVYSIIESPLPVADYRATLTATSADSGCVVRWSSEFSAAGAPDEDAKAVIGGIYDAGLDALKQRFGGS